MFVKWALSDSRHCNVEVAEWFPSPEARSRLLEVPYFSQAQAFGTEQDAKSGSLAKLAIGDDVRLVRKTAVVMRAK